jgi:hypothetical protein
MQDFIMEVAENELPFIVVENRVGEVVNEGLKQDWNLSKFWISFEMNSYWFLGTYTIFFCLVMLKNDDVHNIHNVIGRRLLFH